MKLYKEQSAVILAAIIAAKRAGNAILEVYESDFAVEQKGDKTPLTLADRRSHEIISENLGSLPDDFPVLSEEGKDIAYSERKRWDYFWLVDPLDGTKEFINRNGEFTVNIALIKGRRPVMGVIYVPVKGIFYFGAESIGSYKLDSGLVSESMYAADEMDFFAKVMRNSEKMPIKSSGHRYTIVCSRSHMSAETENYVEELKARNGEVEFISAGSSIKFCLVAEGKADIYPRFGPTMEWDTAAGQAIVEQAGGMVMDFVTQRALLYNKENLLNPWFIAEA